MAPTWKKRRIAAEDAPRAVEKKAAPAPVAKVVEPAPVAEVAVAPKSVTRKRASKRIVKKD
jgi:hypothetical protein